MAHGPAGSEMLRLDRPTQRSHHAEADGMGRFARRNEASSQLVAWGGVSRTADLGGPVHYVDFGGPAAAPRVVLVHGLGGSHLNWCLLAPRLVAKARLLAVDLVGFGLTHPEGRAATVQSAAVMLDRFVREVAGAPAILVGCCVDPARVPQELVAASVALAEERVAVAGLDAAFLSAARSLLRVSARRGRYWRAMRAVGSPVLLLHGEKDRLVSVQSAYEAAARNPDWRFEVLSDVGHVPQLEVPDAVAGLILDWLGTEGATAARRAAKPAAGSRTGTGPTGAPQGPGGTAAR